MEPVVFVVASLVFLGALVVSLSAIFRDSGLSEAERPAATASPAPESERSKVA